ncbi:uncharacterized protein DS421_13g422170 [Arachis hypogaea]|nr:uncharacterized protein DS421_13g422170 [Arachis hypogaea]
MLILSRRVTAKVRKLTGIAHRSCCLADAIAWVAAVRAAIDGAAMFSDFCEFRLCVDPPKLLAAAGTVAGPVRNRSCLIVLFRGWVLRFWLPSVQVEAERTM